MAPPDEFDETPLPDPKRLSVVPFPADLFLPGIEIENV